MHHYTYKFFFFIFDFKLLSIVTTKKAVFFQIKMSFDCVVQWDNGARDTVAITDLFMDQNLAVSWKYDDEWIGRVKNIEDTNNVETLWEKDESINSVHIRHLKLLSPESYLGKRVSWKDSSDPAEGEIVRKIAMPKSRKRKLDCLQNKTLDVHLLTPIRESQLPQLSESFMSEMISQTNDVEFPEFEDPSCSIFSPVRSEKGAVAENVDEAENEANKWSQTTCHVCRKTFRGKNKCINCKKLCHKYCCVYETLCSFQPVICKECSGKRHSRNCYIENCFNSCAFSCDGCGQFLCDHHFDEDCQECRKLAKRFRSRIIPQDKVTSENSSVCTSESECNASANEQETFSKGTSENDPDEPLADLMGKTVWKRNLYETSKFDFDQNKQQSEKTTELRTPLQYFLDYFREPFLSEIVESSILYSKQQNPDSPFKLSTTDLKQFLGIVVFMTIVKLGASRRYWSKQLHLDFVAKTMTVEKFESIIRYLHFKEDPAQAGSRTRKFQRIIDHFNSVCSDYEMKEHLSIDEQIISYKGIKSSLRQYNPKKLKKWEYKVFLLCGEGGIKRSKASDYLQQSGLTTAACTFSVLFQLGIPVELLPDTIEKLEDTRQLLCQEQFLIITPIWDMLTRSTHTLVASE